MTNEQLIDVIMKLQDSLMTKQAELINDNNEFREKLNFIETKLDDLRKENETLQSKLVIAEKNSATLYMHHKNLNYKIIEMEGNMHRLEQYPRRECI